MFQKWDTSQRTKGNFPLDLNAQYYITSDHCALPKSWRNVRGWCVPKIFNGEDRNFLYCMIFMPWFITSFCWFLNPFFYMAASAATNYITTFGGFCIKIEFPIFRGFSKHMWQCKFPFNQFKQWGFIFAYLDISIVTVIYCS